MTVKVDNKKRVVLLTARPGDRFDLKVSGTEFRLVLLKPASRPHRARLDKGPRGYRVAAGPKPITQEQVRAALNEFP
jgi:hypothetical protein